MAGPAQKTAVAYTAVGTASMSDVLKSIKGKFSKTNNEIIYDRNRKVEFETSGCLIFDMVAGGGFPKGRLSEVFGMEHSGKSSTIFAAMAAIQRRKGVAILIDAETAWDPVYAQKTYGLVEDGETFIVIQPDNIEEIDEVCGELSKLKKLDFLAFDSVDAMKPKALIEGALADERRVGSHAQAMSRFVAKMKRFAKDKKIPVVFINQMRTNITTGRESDQNTGTGAGFNPMEKYTVTGGMALRFYASLRMKLEYGGRVEDEMGTNAISGAQDKVRSGNMIKIINIKNKCATPFLKGLATFMFPTASERGGWANDQDLLELLKKRGRIKQISTRFVYEGLRENFQNVGAKKASEAMFLGNPTLMADARALLDSLLKPANPTDAPAAALLEVATGEDFSAEEVEGQDVVHESVETEAGISLAGLVDDEGPIEDTTPSEEVSM